MAIILKNGNSSVPEQKTPAAAPIETPNRRPQSAKYTIEKKSVKGVASTETALIVNGKQKSIGRKSHYLLDMLTLDDE